MKGGNYGWPLREATHQFQGKTKPKRKGSGPRPDLIEPIWDYHHDIGRSITGGSVYRGKEVPQLEGGYIYADYVSGEVWGLWYDSEKKQVTANRELLKNGLPILSFGEDDDGEIYFLNENGTINKFARPETGVGN